jgi:hypothetical protein
MAHGSLRQRGRDAWELRVYQGIDRTTGRQRWITKTVHGTQRFARRQLEDLVVEAGKGRIRAGTIADLLDRWFEAASPSWAAPIVNHARSIIDCHMKPDLGHLDVAKLTTEDIDDFYGHLLRRGGRDGRPLVPALSRASTACCIGRWPRPCAGSGFGRIRRRTRRRLELAPPRSARRLLTKWRCCSSR